MQDSHNLGARPTIAETPRDSSGCSTKRLARMYSGGGETVTLANRDGAGGDHGKRDIDDQDKEVNPRTGVGNEAAWGRQRGTERVQRQEKGRAG